MIPTNGTPFKPPGVGLVVLGAGLFALIHTFALLAPILLSFFLVVLISLALDPVVRSVSRWTGGRTTATALLAAGFVVILGLTSWAFLGPMTSSVSKLSDQIPQYWEKLQKPLIKIEQKAVQSEERLQAEVKTEIAHTNPTPPNAAQPLPPPRRTTEASAPPTTTTPSPTPAPVPTAPIRSGLSHTLQSVAGAFAGVAFNAAQIFVVGVTVFFGVFFTLLDPLPVFGLLYALVPEKHHDRTRRIAKRISGFLPRWAAATALGMLIIGGLVFLLMWPFFGIRDALLLGMIAGVFEAFPYFGPILSAVPALLFALVQGGSTPLWVVLCYVGVQALENNIILPYIMAREMALHPVAVIFAMLLCVLAFGVLGVVIAAPLVTITEILYDELYRKRFLPSVSRGDLHRMVQKDLSEARLATAKH